MDDNDKYKFRQMYYELLAKDLARDKETLRLETALKAAVAALKAIPEMVEDSDDAGILAVVRTALAAAESK